MSLELKICGLNNLNNIKELSQSGTNYLGFIFYKDSTRNIELNPELVKEIKSLRVKKVGVFVNESIQEIQKKCDLLNLDYVQLHGDETPEKCKEIQNFSKIIKVFKIFNELDFEDCKKFDFADLFLFDTKGKKEGGNGIKFDWELLENYQMEIPFLLSGGIRFRDIDGLKELDHKMLKGIDVNSAFEIQPGLKNIELLKNFEKELR